MWAIERHLWRIKKKTEEHTLYYVPQDCSVEPERKGKTLGFQGGKAKEGGEGQKLYRERESRGSRIWTKYSYKKRILFSH